METKHKKLTSKAGLTIPKDIRLAAGFAGGMVVDIEKTADGIMIRKHRPTCCYCAVLIMCALSRDVIPAETAPKKS